MIYLIFRTDRIGDFLVTAPLIKSIRRNDLNSQICIVASKKNYKYLKNNSLIDKVYLLKSNNLFSKVKLFFELKKHKFDIIIVADKKNRSIILSFFLNANKKIFNVSKKFQKKIISFFCKNVFLDNDNITKETLKTILNKNCKALEFDLNDDDFHYLIKDQFKKFFSYEKDLKINNLDYVLFHYDEKWEIENYLKSFKKAANFTSIEGSYENILNFLFELSKKTKKKIIITTGAIDTKLIALLKIKSKQVSQFLYQVNTNNINGYLLTNQDFFSMSHLISKCKLFISCHGAFTHIASNYKVKIIDIVEKNKIVHYSKITSHMINHKHLYRDSFENLSEKIIANS